MIPAKVKYETHDQKLLAIVKCFKQWKHYLKDCQFTVIVISNHNNLKYFISTTTLNRRQTRWSLLLDEYNFEIKYKTNSLNPTDEPSRRPNYENEMINNTCLSTLQNKLQNITIAKIKRLNNDFNNKKSNFESENESELNSNSNEKSKKSSKQIIRKTNAKKTCNKKSIYKNTTEKLLNTIKKIQFYNKFCQTQKAKLDHIKSQTKKGLPINKTIQKTWTINNNNILRYYHVIYIPKKSTLKTAILLRYHDNPLTKHFDSTKIINLIQKKFYWKYMRKNIEKYVKKCAICQRTKAHYHKPYKNLIKLPVPTKSWKKININMITKLPPSKWRNNVYNAIIIIINRYSKMTIYLPIISTIKTNEICDLLCDEMFFKFEPLKK